MPALKTPHLIVDVVELHIAVRVLRTQARLAVRLQAVLEIVQHVGHQTVAYVVAQRPRLLRQTPNALRRPAQGRIGMARGRRLHQRLQIHHQSPVLLHRGLASCAERRVRSAGSAACSSDCTSRIPRVIIERDMPVARSTNAMPPWLNAAAPMPPTAASSAPSAPAPKDGISSCAASCCPWTGDMHLLSSDINQLLSLQPRSTATLTCLLVPPARSSD